MAKKLKKGEVKEGTNKLVEDPKMEGLLKKD
jgi:hypothetical protein